MFDKLMKLLFKEEEYVEEEEIEIRPVRVNMKDDVRPAKKVEGEQAKPEPIEKPVTKLQVKEKESRDEAKISNFKPLDVSEPKRKADADHFVVSASTTEYEIPPRISPMYGVKDHEDVYRKPVIEKKVTLDVEEEPATTITKGDLLSPFSGPIAKPEKQLKQKKDRDLSIADIIQKKEASADQGEQVSLFDEQETHQ